MENWLKVIEWFYGTVTVISRRGDRYGYCNMHRSNGRYLYVTGHLIITSNANSKENIDINDNVYFDICYLENIGIVIL